VPVRFIHGAAQAVYVRACGAAWAIRALLPRRRVLLFEHLFDDQIGPHDAAPVLEEHGARAVAYENQGVMRNAGLVHTPTPYRIAQIEPQVPLQRGAGTHPPLGASSPAFSH